MKEFEKFRKPECKKCHRKFTTRGSLVRHLSADTCETGSNKSSNLPTKTLSLCCDDCKRKFSRVGSLIRHVKAGVCIKKTTTKTEKSKKKFECNDCGVKYAKKCSLARHLTKCDGKQKEYRGVTCLKCGYKVLSKSEMKKHYSENHGISFKVTNETFQSFEEFQKWMNDIERTNTFRFRIIRKKKNTSHTVMDYQCHRSGTYVDSCANKRRKRFLKNCGSKKVGWCPAELKVRIQSSDGTCAVQYQETHIGHNIRDEKELCHVYLRKEEKLEIAAHIAEGVPIPHLQKKLRLSEADTQNYSRISTINLKDLHNIASSYGILRDHSLSVNDDDKPLIKEYTESGLYDKRHGEADTEYHTTSLYKKKDDRVKQIRMQLISKLDFLRKRHHMAADYLEKNDSINVCYVDGETFIIQSFKEPAEGLPKTYTVTKNELKECAQTDSACVLFCNQCGICSHEFSCTCIDSSIKNNMCKHIHAIGISKPISTKNESCNYVTIICENVESNFQDNVEHWTVDVKDDVEVDDYIPLQCENTENAEMKRFTEKIEVMSDVEDDVDYIFLRCENTENEEIKRCTEKIKEMSNVDDDVYDHTPLKCDDTENTEDEEMKRVAEEMKEMFANFIAYASSKEQLYEIRKKYLLPIKPTLLAAGKSHNST